MRRLPPEAAARYRQDGYCVVAGCVEHQHIDAYLRDLTQVVAAQLDSLGLPSLRDGFDLDALYDQLAVLHGHDQTAYVATLRVFNKLKSLYELFLADGIADACSELGVVLPLMHTLPLFHVMSYRLRLDEGYHGFEAHQDWTGLQTSLNAVVVWLPLHDIDRERFPLEVLPKSHLQGLWRETEGSEAFMPVEVAKGDAVFMTPFTVHRTGLSKTPRLRTAVSWRYEDALEPTFVERGYPFAQTRTVNHDLLFPGFPDAAQMHKLLIPHDRRSSTAS